MRETDGSISERCELKDEERVGGAFTSASINSLAILLKVHVKEAKLPRSVLPNFTMLQCSQPLGFPFYYYKEIPREDVS